MVLYIIRAVFYGYSDLKRSISIGLDGWRASNNVSKWESSN